MHICALGACRGCGCPPLGHPTPHPSSPGPDQTKGHQRPTQGDDGHLKVLVTVASCMLNGCATHMQQVQPACNVCTPHATCTNHTQHVQPACARALHTASSAALLMALRTATAVWVRAHAWVEGHICAVHAQPSPRARARQELLRAHAWVEGYMCCTCTAIRARAHAKGSRALPGAQARGPAVKPGMPG